jgi:cysteine desulfurase/selenocysteine lyase
MNDVQTPYNIEQVRKQFPVLHQEVNSRPLIYFDNAASSQKPLAVIDAIRDYYLRDHSNIHRGVHHLARRATDAYEAVRDGVAAYLKAEARECIIFTAGTTDGINLVAQSWGRAEVKQGDVILVSALEHHSNLVPWQMLAHEKGAEIRVIPIDERGVIDLDAYGLMLEERPKLVAFNHVSNSLGTINPVIEMTAMAKAVGATVLIDGAQSIPHTSVDVSAIGCDFYCFSAHKAYGPTGVGVLYGKREVLDQMPPWRGGGEMIASVSYTASTWNELPYKFEAGTPNIAGVVGLGAAIAWMEALDVEQISAHEHELTQYATRQLKSIQSIRIFGEAPHKAGVISFLAGAIHPYDLGTLLDQMGIAVRTGHHCTEPLMHRLGIPGTVRCSFACYNTREEVDRFIQATEKAVAMLT